MKRLATLLVTLCLCLSAVQAQFEVKVIVKEGIPDPTVRSRVEQSMSQVLTAFNNAVTEGKKIKGKLKEIGLPEPTQECISGMWKSSAMLCPVSEIRERAAKTSNGGYQIRNIPVSILAADDDDQDLVFQFDQNGVLQNVSVALEKHNYNQVILKGISEEDLTRRQVILDFVENLRTAYNRKDLPYLKQVYSDDALIITGTYLKKKNTDNSNLMGNLGSNNLVIQQMTKKEYIERCERNFKRNAYINLKFEELTVRRHPKHDNIYGVTLKQHWNSSTYSDVGWLFLMINFGDEENPSIEVRTWQPDEFQGQKITRDEVFSLDNFNI